ncbi:MAG: YdcH family protein [Sneathiellaceae bacterium]
MSMQTHMQSLSEKHAAIEQTIAEELKRPLPDEARVVSLKKQKLRLKEELARYPVSA